jgi:hypothetical protein
MFQEKFVFSRVIKCENLRLFSILPTRNQYYTNLMLEKLKIRTEPHLVVHKVLENVKFSQTSFAPIERHWLF